mmetsp:Transcript_38628/g.115971  ORF Transcript_38628/g.115971 Transcript_38628/m.115971 type:complete len:234 (-) Transcript_38628:1152-1853(-)
MLQGGQGRTCLANLFRFSILPFLARTPPVRSTSRKGKAPNQAPRTCEIRPRHGLSPLASLRHGPDLCSIMALRSAKSWIVKVPFFRALFHFATITPTIGMSLSLRTDGRCLSTFSAKWNRRNSSNNTRSFLSTSSKASHSVALGFLLCMNPTPVPVTGFITSPLSGRSSSSNMGIEANMFSSVGCSPNLCRNISSIMSPSSYIQAPRLEAVLDLSRPEFSAQFSLNASIVRGS